MTLDSIEKIAPNLQSIRWPFESRALCLAVTRPAARSVPDPTADRESDAASSCLARECGLRVAVVTSAGNDVFRQGPDRQEKATLASRKGSFPPTGLAGQTHCSDDGKPVIAAISRTCPAAELTLARRDAIEAPRAFALDRAPVRTGR